MVVNHIIGTSLLSQNQQELADLNTDGIIDILDIVEIINLIFERN